MPERNAHLVVGSVVAVMTVEVLIAGAQRFDAAVVVLSGDTSLRSVGGLLGLLWLPVVLIVLGVAGRHLLRLGEVQCLQEQTIRTDAAACRDWVWTADANLVLTDSNDRVRDLLGWEAREVIGLPTTAFLADTDEEPPRDARRGLRDKTGWSDVTTRWRHRAGHVVELTGSATCIVDHHGDVVAVRGTRCAIDETSAQRADRDRLRAAVRHVLALEDLHIAAQPIQDVTTRQVVGVEALARFPDGRSPATWFAEAASVGLGVELELLALRKSIDACGGASPSAYLSVNVSPEAILDPRTADVLERAGTRLDLVVLEITEHVEICRYDDLIAALAPLRAAGVRLAVDDAGAGFASFQHILTLRPDIIKLDRSLVANIENDGGRQAFVTAVVLIGLQLGALITAEGVETLAELRTVTDLGVDCAQGHLLGRPARAQHEAGRRTS